MYFFSVPKVQMKGKQYGSGVMVLDNEQLGIITCYQEEG